MSEPLIETPSSAEWTRPLAVARRWLPVFLAGQRADEDVYADSASTWHNITETESQIPAGRRRGPNRFTPAPTSGSRTCDYRVFDGGWILQATTVGTSALGEPVRVPTCLVASGAKAGSRGSRSTPTPGPREVFGGIATTSDGYQPDHTICRDAASTRTTARFHDPLQIQGSVAAPFSAVRDAFAEVLNRQPGTGASFAVWHDGEWVVDLWGGYADAAHTRPWARDTMVMPYSVTKPFAALPRADARGTGAGRSSTRR